MGMPDTTAQDAGIVAFERFDGMKRVLVALNVNDTHTAETSASATGGGDMLTSFPAGTQLSDVLGGGTVTVGAGGAVKVQLPPRGQMILVPTTDVVPLP